MIARHGGHDGRKEDMTIHYEGINPETGLCSRTAVIFYNENKEQATANKVLEILENYGWEVLQEEESAYIPVSDRRDYNRLVEDYKYAKTVK